LFALDQRTGKPIGEAIGNAKPAATRGEKLYRSYAEAMADIQRQGATDTHAVRQDPVSGGFYITEKRGNDLLGALMSSLGGGGMPKVNGAGGAPGVKQYANEEAAAVAAQRGELKPGERVTIGGVAGTWR
jgi:hypothetical protein